jgi:hypothetical protein
MTIYWHLKINNDFHWVVDDGGSHYLLYDNTGRPFPNRHKLEKTADLQTIVAAHFGSHTTVQRTHFLPGQYYPRMHRSPNYPRLSDTYHYEWSQSLRAVRNILVRMTEVFRIVEPAPANFAVFGHEFRQLLILACTEVESSCKAVMKANGYLPSGRWSTNDYVKLILPLRLKEWEVGLTHCPGYPTIKPFFTWDPAKPTESLPWYKAYNEVKHDREANLSLATLAHMVSSAAAAYLLVIAQFGKFGLRGVTAHEIDAFYVTEWLTWPLADHHVPPKLLPGAAWAPINYSF